MPKVRAVFVDMLRIIGAVVERQQVDADAALVQLARQMPEDKPIAKMRGVWRATRNEQNGCSCAETQT
ncbi:MAG: hypothetical protein F4063_05145 [Chloroflexi bacterium]|nr:hypothetical protein [Chloroflexota bacterium]MYD39695.1 hypothetical protein [Chloroflexota bacterium]MYI41314.1 hypothetical protein [Chloroflexota bacterium]